MTTTPRVSVIIPTYNREPYLKRAIDSVLAQTSGDFELIVMDDASTDGTPALVQAITDPRLRYFRNEANSGVSATRNRGIARATSELVAFLDSDDEWVRDKLEKQLSEFSKAPPEVGLIVCGAWNRNVPSDSSPFADSPERVIDITETVPYGLPPTQTWLIRRQVLQDAGLFDTAINCFEDFDLAIRIATRSRVLLVNEPLVVIETTSGSLFSDLSNRVDGFDKLYRKHKDLFARDPRLHSFNLAYLGQLYAASGDASHGRPLFAAAIRANPANLRAWGGWLASLGGAGAFRFYLRAGRAIRKRFAPGRRTPVPKSGAARS